MMQSYNIESYATTYTYIYHHVNSWHGSFETPETHGPWGLVPANADGERLWLVPSPAKGFFYLVGQKM